VSFVSTLGQSIRLRSASAVLAASLCLPVFGGVDPRVGCSTRLISAASQAKYLKIRKYLKKAHLHPRLAATVPQVLDQWAQAGKVPPSMGAATGQLKDLSYMVLDIAFPEEVTVRTDFETGPLSGVRALLINQQNGFFRAGGYAYNWAAYQLNLAMGLNTVAPMQPAVIQNQFGILSMEVVGVPLEDYMGFGFNFPELERMVLQGEVDAASLSEVEGFHFLVGDEDGRSGNFQLTPDGRVVGYDFDYAFTQGFAWNAGCACYLGHIFPRYYTPRFINGLNLITDEQINQRAGVLPLSARRQVAFRRDLMKADILNRGENAILRDQTYPLDHRRE
jgi:hypothetical protein